MTRTIRKFTRPEGLGSVTVEAYTDDGKVWRWTSDDQPPRLAVARSYGIPVDQDSQQAAREEYDKLPKPSPWEQFQMIQRAMAGVSAGMEGRELCDFIGGKSPPVQ